MVEQNVAALTQDLAKQQQAILMAQQTPQYQQMAQTQPEQVQQITVQAQQLIETSQNAIAKLQAKPTFEQVMNFLRDNRARAFVLDIETDSTILVDENAEKQRRSEFMGVLAQLLPQLTAMIASEPATAEFCGEALKFFVAPYRAGRGLDSAIDNLVELMQQKSQQQRGDDPQTMAIKSQEKIETQKVQVQREKIENDKNIEMIKIKQKDDHDKARLAQERDIKVAELRGGEREDQAKAQQANLKMMQERQKAQVNSLKAAQDMRVNQQKMDLAHQQSQLKAADMNARQQERQAAQAFRQQQAAMRPMPGAGRPM
jgi:hypothetical protein